MSVVRNPVLPGFHPDPSAVRVGDDFFVATSTFEWLPGVRLHHSRDLVHFRPVGHALTRPRQLDLCGVPDSAGVWAPSLTHDGHAFHLAYSVVSDRRGFPLVSLANYTVSAPSIEGPWSDPLFLNGTGWDPSLFHDGDGRTWLLNMVLDPRAGEPATRGITLQEYAPSAGRLIGEPVTIFAGTPLGCTEGPQLLRRGGAYYLVTAEGGTSWGHAATVARAARLQGPYEADPAGPLLTARDDAGSLLQKAGHASLVDTPRGEWFAFHLCARPFAPGRHAPLGRETAIQRLRWTEDGWPRLASGGHLPDVVVDAPELPATPFASPPARDDFEAPALSPEWMSLRVPIEEHWASLRARPGHLRLRGREPLFSRHRQSLVARRWCHPRATVETVVDFQPASFHEAAGLVCLCDTRDFVYLHVTHDERVGRCLALGHADGGKMRTTGPRVALPDGGRCFLRASWDESTLHFFWSVDGESWHAIGGAFATAQLSDDHDGKDGFTGACVGLAVQDPARQQRCADFDWFTYRGDDGQRS